MERKGKKIRGGRKVLIDEEKKGGKRKNGWKQRKKVERKKNCSEMRD